MPYAHFIRDEFTFMHDDAQNHTRTAVVRNLFLEVDISVLEWKIYGMN